MLNRTSASEGFLTELKQRTQPSHQALEQLPLSRALTSSRLTKEQYITYLQTMYLFVNDIEDKVYLLVSELIPKMDERGKKHLLFRDLEQLGATVPSPQPVLGEFATDDLAIAMGIMYVLEGSTLGGRVILKSLERSLGYSAGNGAAYFAGYGGETGQLWKLFLDSLTIFAAEPERQPKIIEGAEMAFQTIYQLLKEKTPDLG